MKALQKNMFSGEDEDGGVLASAAPTSALDLLASTSGLNLTQLLLTSPNASSVANAILDSVMSEEGKTISSI